MNIYEQMKKQELYIFGGGERGKLIFSILDKRSISVKAFIDNDVDKQGSNICGVECISIETAMSIGVEKCGIIVSPIDNADIFSQLEKYGIKYIYEGESVIQQHYYFPIITDEHDYILARPFNFYESPFYDISEIRKKEEDVFDYSKKALEINFNLNRQIELLKQMEQYDIINWSREKQEKYRFYYNNAMFSTGSSDSLYYMLRILKPEKIIEVGSGFSTAVMLDTNDICFQNRIKITSIEPYPERLKSLLRETDNLEIYESDLQDIPIEYFEQLKENDILFIDSSHVAKLGSDINYYLFEIFPRLAKGVYIHIHDIFYPFIYPKNWIWEGRPYNEMYMLQAFLMNNERYSVQFFGDMLMKEHPELLSDKLKEIGGSLWIKKEY